MAHTFNKLKGFAVTAAAAASFALAPVAAFAAPMQGSVTINGLQDGDQVKLYKVVDIDVNDQNVATSTWVDDLEELDDEDMSTWQSFQTDSAEAQAMAHDIAGYVSEDTNQFAVDGNYTVYPGTAEGSSVTIGGVESGQYLVVVTAPNGDVTRVYQDTIVSVLPEDSDGNGSYDAASGSAVLKATEMDTPGKAVLDKKIDENGFDVEGGLVDASDNFDFKKNVNFQISALVPQYTGNADGRTYTITDTMSDGLTLNEDSFVVKLDGETLSLGTDYTMTPTQDGFTLSLTSTALKKVGTRAGEQLVVQFTAAVEDDVTYVNDETNAAHLMFSNDSVTDNMTTTDDDAVSVSFYAVTFTKVGEQEDALAALKGATFELKDADGVVIDELTTADNGVVTFDGLAEGTYTLHEKAAPAGYAPIEDIVITVADGGTMSVAEGDNATAGAQADGLTTLTGVAVDGTDPVSGQIIDPVSRIELPVTGGMGTIAFTAAGVVIMAGAAAYIIHSRKQNN